jgi:hypothetical protein
VSTGWEIPELMARRAVAVLDCVPKERRAEVSVIAFVVRWAEADPRYQVVEVAADAGTEAGTRWEPSSFAFPALGAFGAPDEENAELARLWAAHNERVFAERWSAAAGTTPSWTNPDGTLTALALLRGRYVAYMSHCARRVRRRLRRRVGWRDEWTMFTVTDAVWDDVYPASQLVNDASLPDGLQQYLFARSDGAAGL